MKTDIQGPMPFSGSFKDLKNANVDKWPPYNRPT